MQEFKAIFEARGIVDKNDECWKTFLYECDENGDGEIELGEFKNMLNMLMDH